MKRLFIEIHSCQKAKREASMCGDFLRVERTAEATTVLLCDGLGSGLKANLYARFYASRLLENLNHGESFRESCKSILETLHAVRSENIPFSAFTAIRILPDGQGTVFNYEMPPPFLIEDSSISILKPRHLPISGEIVGETLFKLTPGNALLVVSDGITQAGLGILPGTGIGSEGARDYIEKMLVNSFTHQEIPEHLVQFAKQVSKGEYGDDTSAVLLRARNAKSVTILTGPPRERSQDKGIVHDFLKSAGEKIICGSSTTEMFARETGLKVNFCRMPDSPFEPPVYSIPGIDLVTEGCMMLNQVSNLLDETLSVENDGSPVSRMVQMLLKADTIYFMTGNAGNPGHESTPFFKQIGLAPRREIVQRIAMKLETLGKLAVIRPY